MNCHHGGRNHAHAQPQPHRPRSRLGNRGLYRFHRLSAGCFCGRGVVSPSLTRLHRAISRLPRPQNDAEFAVLTELCFGLPASLETLRLCFFRVNERYDQMFSSAFLEYHSRSVLVNDYEYSHWVFNRCIGRLGTGGTAGVSYGSFSLTGHRDNRRIEHWILSRSGKRSSYLRTHFARLDRQLRDGKNREIRGIPVLTTGRADGAEAAFICGVAS